MCPVSESAPAPQPDSQPSATPSTWFWRGALAGVTSVQGLVLFASMVGFGGLCRDIGFPIGAAMLSTLLIWALPAQVLVVGGYAAGSAAAVIALAVGLSSIRMFPMTAAIMPFLRGRGSGIGTQLLAAHFVAVTAWIEGMRRLPVMAPEARVPFFFGIGTLLILSATFATLLGFLLAGTLPRSLAIGLLFLTPLSFLIQLSHNARDLVDRLSLAFGLLLAPFFAVYGGRLDLLWTGLVGGAAAWGVHRFIKKRKEKGGV
jgi:predicted branched-subunit amino acid permease